MHGVSASHMEWRHQGEVGTGQGPTESTDEHVKERTYPCQGQQKQMLANADKIRTCITAAHNAILANCHTLMYSSMNL